VTYYSRNERVCSGNGFLPKKKNQADFCKTTFETAIRNQNLNIIGWRDVPDVSNLGQISRKEPTIIKQVFIGKNGLELTEQQFNAKLFAKKNC
jgi:glutamate synthase (ferredoxin)